MQIISILADFGIAAEDFKIDRIGTGYINATYRLTGVEQYILQRVNKNVFTRPEIIAANLRAASDFLHQHYPDYLFLTPRQTKRGHEMVYDEEGFPWRLFPYIKNSITIDKVDTPEEAFSAATEFARLTRYLGDVDVTVFKPTIDSFHDLNWRARQFIEALKGATPERLQEAEDAIQQCKSFLYLVDRYNDLVNSKTLQLRVMHNDTKINNILFDTLSRKATCVIDLDTLMPGYFIYDVGDMIRTFVSPVSEEERDLRKIIFRNDIYNALERGYREQMGDLLNSTEQTLFPFAGMMMTYIMALRMLADYLNGNIYYQITYPDQNLVRARNQLRLLTVIKESLE